MENVIMQEGGMFPSKKLENLKVKRGEIWMANLGEENILHSEQRGYRPVLVIQNDMGNRYSPTVVVACITTKRKTGLPTHMSVDLFQTSTILFEQIKTINKDRLNKKIAELSEEEMLEANEKIMISMGII